MSRDRVSPEKPASGLNLARGSRAKIRTVLRVLFNHACRHELYDRNPRCLTMTRDGFLAESYAAWPLHFARPAPRGLSVFDFGRAFSIPDKRSRGTEILEGAYLPLRHPENPRN